MATLIKDCISGFFLKWNDFSEARGEAMLAEAVVSKTLTCGGTLLRLGKMKGKRMLRRCQRATHARPRAALKDTECERVEPRT